MKDEARSMNKKGGLARRSPALPAGRPGEGGFTLMELVVSFSIFIILVSLTTVTFAQTLKTQRIVSNLSVSMNNVSFVSEQMAREIRTGTEFNDADGEVLTLRFTNAKNEKVSYKKINNGIGRCIGDCNTDSDYKTLTSPSIKINNLKFVLKGTKRGDNFAPRITILTGVAGPRDINVNLQITISARVIEGDS